MRFCDDCGTYLKEKKEGLWCPKCKKVVHSRLVLKPRSFEKKESTAVHVLDKSRFDHVKVSRACPKCGNGEAYRWFSSISGEHAGIRRERTVEHYKCTKCSYLWSESS